jgi:tRNA threonylcarbamoyladenosine biosynthesis protein TsaE
MLKYSMTQSIKLVSHSGEETDTLAKLLSELLQPGLVIALIGDLGTGKTTLVRSLLRHSGVTEQ